MLRQKRVTPVRTTKPLQSSDLPLRAERDAFLDWTLAVGLAEQTAAIRRSALNEFLRWCSRRSIVDACGITRDLLEQYQGHLFHRRKADGRPLALSTQVTRLNPIKAFCKWLARSRQVPFNPAADLVVPRVPRRLPGRVLTPAEADRVMHCPDTGTPSGVRDRAILEVLYSTGMRRMEVVRLSLADVLLDQCTAFVRRGKGGRDRVVPLGGRAVDWVGQYLSDVRGHLGGVGAESALFLTDYGEPFRRNRLGDLVKRYLGLAGIAIPGACHAFRHACATHMLENGADIRFIQSLLGHADLSTTQIYTRVSIGKLREVHARTHPTGRCVVPRPAIARHAENLPPRFAA